MFPTVRGALEMQKEALQVPKGTLEVLKGALASALILLRWKNTVLVLLYIIYCMFLFCIRARVI
jgi:hypothetical protein